MIKYITQIQELTERFISISTLIQKINIIIILLKDLLEIYQDLIIILNINSIELTLKNIYIYFLNKEIQREDSSHIILEKIILLVNKKSEKFYKKKTKRIL